jgi:hypothetical protein
MLSYDATENPQRYHKKDFLLLFANPLLFFLLFLTFTTLSGLGLLAAHATRATATEGRGESEVDVLLGVKADHVGGDVDDLLSDTVTLLAFASIFRGGGRMYRM